MGVFTLLQQNARGGDGVGVGGGGGGGVVYINVLHQGAPT